MDRAGPGEYLLLVLLPVLIWAAGVVWIKLCDTVERRRAQERRRAR